MNIQLTLSGRVYCAFWIFGLLNNVLYVVILSAAIDLVGPTVPKSVVLLSDAVPSFLIKLVAPFFIARYSYPFRVGVLILLDFVGMLTIALARPVPLRLVGVALASLSAGLGEISFLALSHFYGEWALAGFSSGTGAAGLVGSFIFLAATSWLGVSSTMTLLAFAIAPFGFLLTYGLLLPPLPQQLSPQLPPSLPPSLGYNQLEANDDELDESRKQTVAGTFTRLRPLVKPYMIPLFLVYMSEYIINQGISPTLLFPLDEMPFSRFRDVYVTYGTLYQLGVLISRSSSPFVRVHKVYIPSLLQALNLLICVIQALYVVIPNVYLMMVLVLYEGVLGGLAYVNTFLLVSEQVPVRDREFSLGAVGVSDSAGVVLAGFLSLWLEKALCSYQKATGRPWCELD